MPAPFISLLTEITRSAWMALDCNLRSCINKRRRRPSELTSKSKEVTNAVAAPQGEADGEGIAKDPVSMVASSITRSQCTITSYRLREEVRHSASGRC